MSPTRSEPKVRRERGAGRSGPGRLGIERPKDCNRPRRAMSSASFATLTPALVRRTLAWLSTGLFRGMSRDALNTILVTEVLRDRRASSLSLALQPVAGRAL